ncbi:MAG: hypothetical protein Q8L48_39525 [Archangium sp.]|nr:hypothetical protein [Archangium sp.]
MSLHLDAQRWRALQEKRDPALLAHLEQGCEVCDAFLESVAGLEGEVDRALLALAPRPPSTDELAWARLRRHQRARPWRHYAAAAAVLVVLGAGAWAMLPPPDELKPTGLKGSAQARLELRAALKSSNGTLTAIVDGAKVSSASALVFQVRSGVAGPARLYVQRGAAAPAELAQLGLVEGAQELEWDGADESGEPGKHLIGFSLAGERGPLTVWLVASEAPSSAEAALAAIRAGGGEGLAVAQVRVNVVDTVSP